MKADLAQMEEEYAQLRARLGRLGWISHGYVQDRAPAGTRATIQEISKTLLRAPDGHLFPLGRVARLVTVTGNPKSRATTSGGWRQ